MDPNGEAWETPEDEKKANELKCKAIEQIAFYQEQVAKYTQRYDKAKSTWRKRNLAFKINYNNCLMEEVSQGIDGLEEMGKSSKYFHFEEVARGEDCFVKREENSKDNIHITIYSDDMIETRWHECKHVQDWLNGVFPITEHDFDSDEILGNLNPDVETRAYRSEFAFSRRRFDGVSLKRQTYLYNIDGDQRIEK